MLTDIDVCEFATTHAFEEMELVLQLRNFFELALLDEAAATLYVQMIFVVNNVDK